MSSIAAGSAPATMTALLDLAEFVRHPEYVERVKELQNAQKAHDAAAKKADDKLKEVMNAQAQMSAAIDARMNDVAAREAAVKQREDAVAVREQRVERRLAKMKEAEAI